MTETAPTPQPDLDHPDSPDLPLDMAHSSFKPRVSLQSAFVGLMFVFMYLPILVLVVYSFNESAYSAAWEGFTWEWYEYLLSDSRIFAALRNSLTVAISAVAVSAVLGTLMAVGLARYRFPGRRLYLGISYLPLIIPDIAIAVATLVFFGGGGVIPESLDDCGSSYCLLFSLYCYCGLHSLGGFGSQFGGGGFGFGGHPSSGVF